MLAIVHRGRELRQTAEALCDGVFNLYLSLVHKVPARIQMLKQLGPSRKLSGANTQKIVGAADDAPRLNDLGPGLKQGFEAGAQGAALRG